LLLVIKFYVIATSDELSAVHTFYNLLVIKLIIATIVIKFYVIATSGELSAVHTAPGAVLIFETLDRNRCGKILTSKSKKLQI